MVVGLNLCPFSHTVVAKQQIDYQVVQSADEEAQVAGFLQCLDKLLQADPQQIATSLLILPLGLDDFADYLDFVGLLEDLVEQAQLQELVQLASFHPQYWFDGVEQNDLSNYTNRAPYPTVHLIRQAEMTQALANFDHPEDIPTTNIATLNKLGREQVEQRCPWGKDGSD